jgi:hypothetical protein
VGQVGGSGNDDEIFMAAPETIYVDALPTATMTAQAGKMPSTTCRMSCRQLLRHV